MKNQHYTNSSGDEIKLDDENYLETLPSTGPRQYFREAKEYLERHHTEWEWISPNTEQHRAWQRYFESKNWKLKFMTYSHRVLVPTEWPETFDPSHYNPPERPWGRGRLSLV